jgi:hypothetical protein
MLTLEASLINSDNEKIKLQTGDTLIIEHQNNNFLFSFLRQCPSNKTFFLFSALHDDKLLLELNGMQDVYRIIRLLSAITGFKFTLAAERDNTQHFVIE